MRNRATNQTADRADGPAPDEARVIPLRRPAAGPGEQHGPAAPPAREPLWRDLVGEVLRRERLAQERTLKEVAEAARISMPYLSELERGRKEASSEVLAAAARALGLGLADLLARVHGELARQTRAVAVPPVRTTPASTSRTSTRGPSRRYDGLCLAA